MADGPDPDGPDPDGPEPDRPEPDGPEPDGLDIDGYRGGDAPSENGPAISDSGYPISEGASGAGQAARDIDGYRPRITVSRAEFRARSVYKDSGFESIEEYLDDVEAQWREANGLDPLPVQPERMPTLDERGSKQVGLRLPSRDYERLKELSGENGVSPATMARILIVRAVRRSKDFAEHDDE